MYEIGVVHLTRAAVYRSCFGHFRQKWVQQEFAKISSANRPTGSPSHLCCRHSLSWKARAQKKRTVSGVKYSGGTHTHGLDV